jgi:hypothetical protein
MHCLWIVALVFALSGSSYAEGRVFDWIKASDEDAQLDPADFHAGRVYRPGPDGGNLHVDIQSSLPVTIAMANAEAWNDIQQHPVNLANLSYSCIREHVVNTTYECHLAPNTPMVILVRDERTPNRAIVTGISVMSHIGAARRFISPNDLRITYYRWDCVANCIQPEFQWFRLVKEKYEITSVPKMYNVLTPERDGQQVNVRFKSPVPMTVALLPSKVADRLYENPASLSSALSSSTCKQRGIQSLTFDCTVNIADGPQSLVILPDAEVKHKKAEVEMQAVKCVANCNQPAN